MTTLMTTDCNNVGDESFSTISEDNDEGEGKPPWRPQRDPSTSSPITHNEDRIANDDEKFSVYNGESSNEGKFSWKLPSPFHRPPSSSLMDQFKGENESIPPPSTNHDESYSPLFQNGRSTAFSDNSPTGRLHPDEQYLDWGRHVLLPRPSYSSDIADFEPVVEGSDERMRDIHHDNYARSSDEREIYTQRSSGEMEISHEDKYQRSSEEREMDHTDKHQRSSDERVMRCDEYERSSEEREISREDIENSIRKFERLSKQLEEVRGSGLDILHDDSYHDLDHSHDADHYCGPDRMSMDEDTRNPLSYSFEEISHDQTVLSEEERSKSDGETEELLQREEESIIVQERSKSDGEKNDEDDDDAVPLKISAVGANKSNKLLLSNSWLKTIPSEVWDLTHLTELDLSANYLKKVSKSIGNLNQLKKLRLNHNQLSVLPKEIWGLTKLTALLLNNNCLKAIPKDIKNLVKLKTLDLSSNQINEISTKEGLLNVTSLIELRLRNNLLPSIPVAMAEVMTNLQILWLDGNPLTIPKSIIKKPATVVLSYIKGHPQIKKPGKPVELAKSRILRKSPPLVPGKTGKKDMHIVAEKELKKRKREQLEEMRKHIEVEKKVKLLEHELMLANAKALKFEVEARKVEEQKPPQQPTPYSPMQFAQLPPHVPRHQGVLNNNFNHKSPNTNGDKSSPGNHFEWEIPLSELTFGPRIGRGGYGEVFRGVWGGTEVAIKMLFTDNMSAKLITDLRNEVELLCKLRHPNIVLFMGACTEPETPCIVTEYLGRGSLASILLDESMEIDWGLRLQIGIDCARGMAYLHSRNPVIIHRDLKTDNLLVDDNWQVKVADFGLATVKSRTFAKTMCGTTGWVAPEVLAEEGYTEKADVYSFSIILWEMLTRTIPYAGKNTMQVVRSVDRGERLPIPDFCPPDYAELIKDCWNTDPAKRLSFVEVLHRMESMRVNYLRDKMGANAPVGGLKVAPKDNDKKDHRGPRERTPPLATSQSKNSKKKHSSNKLKGPENSNTNNGEGENSPPIQKQVEDTMNTQNKTDNSNNTQPDNNNQYNSNSNTTQEENDKT